MSQCNPGHDTSSKAPGKYRCPVNGQEYSRVKIKTVLHHVKQPWELLLPEQGYYFCDDADCDVVYFGQDGSIFGTNQVRTNVWQKTSEPDSEICYCFGVNKQQAINNPEIKCFVEAQTREGHCACESRNPSGRCCLKDFPRQ